MEFVLLQLRVEGCLPEWSFLEGVELKVAVAHGLKNARTVMDEIAAGKSEYHFVEVMACPGGCIGGGGQPYSYPMLRFVQNVPEQSMRKIWISLSVCRMRIRKSLRFTKSISKNLSVISRIIYCIRITLRETDINHINIST